MSNIKVVKTLVLTGTALPLVVLSGHPGPGLQTEDIDVSDLSNEARIEKAARPQLEETEIALQCAYDGKLANVGVSASLIITVTKPDDTTIVNTVTGYVKSSLPVQADIGGERRLIQDVVFVPDGSNTAITTTS